MWGHVFILPSKGSTVIDEWLEESFPNINRERWERSSLVWPRHTLEQAGTAAGDGPEQIEIFIRLHDYPDYEGYNPALFGSLLGYARQHAWERNIYLGMDQITLWPGRADARDAAATRQEWFRTILEMNVTDLLELTPEGGEVQTEVKLMNAAARSRERMGILAAAAPGEWKCLFNNPTPAVKAILGPLVGSAPSQSDDANYLLLLRSRGVKSQDFISRTVAAAPGNQFLVARLDETGEESTPALEQFCRDNGLILIKEAFRGLFEVRFFLQQLALRDERRRKHFAPLKVGAEEVRVAASVRFHPPAPAPKLLITHSFYAQDDEQYCVEAARDVYGMVKDLPFQTDVYVHPAIDCLTLPNMVSSLENLTAWVHIGHSTRDDGLLESGYTESYKEPDKWLACFARYTGSIPLVCFAACQSTAAARHFAEAGAGVAVGFAEDVPLAACRLMSVELVKAALSTNGDRAEILEAFYVGRDRLYAGDYNGAGAAAFCSKH